MAKKKSKKPAPAPKKKKPIVSQSKPTPKPKPVKSSSKKSTTPAKSTPKSADKKPAAKAPVEETSAKPAVKTPAPKAPAAKAPVAKPAAPKPSSRADLRSSILAKRASKPAKPIAFSFDEIREIAKTTTTAAEEVKAAGKVAAKPTQKELAAASLRTEKPTLVKAASLADILGFNPHQTVQRDEAENEDIPEKFRRYYKLLIELRDHLTGRIDTHSEETLKRSSKDDAGDLSSYGQHMADAGTDTFDRDFALSMVASEQEALSEVEAAIQRIKNGTYGVCEVTEKPIPKERLIAVPFTRYSTEALKEIEKNRMRSRTQAGLFGEFGEEGGKIMDDGGDDE